MNYFGYRHERAVRVLYHKKRKNLAFTRLLIRYMTDCKASGVDVGFSHWLREKGFYLDGAGNIIRS